jgi:tetratricopeptide (TPR) repeat protein
MTGRATLLVLISLALSTQLVAQDADRCIALGDSLLALDRPQKALEQYESAIKLRPDAHSYSARARAWFYQDRMDRFVMDADKALQLDSVYPEANYQRALYACRAEDFRFAERLLSRGLPGATGKLRDQMLVLRGEARAELKKNAAAIEDLKAGIGDRNDDHEALRTLARLYDANGQYEEALAVLVTLCVVEPENIGHWTNRGYELLELQRYEDALAMFEKALKLDKDEPVARSNRAYCLLKLGRSEEAMADVEQSLKAYPANPYALRTRALLYLAKGEREKACNDLSLAKILGTVPEVDQLIQEHCGGTTAPR